MSQKANHTRRFVNWRNQLHETALELSSHKMGYGEKGTPRGLGNSENVKTMRLGGHGERMVVRGHN